MSNSTQNELSFASKVAELLIHDTECSVTRSGVCTCKFYDVADRIIELIKLELADARKEVIEEIEKMLWSIHKDEVNDENMNWNESLSLAISRLATLKEETL